VDYLLLAELRRVSSVAILHRPVRDDHSCCRVGTNCSTGCPPGEMGELSQRTNRQPPLRLRALTTRAGPGLGTYVDNDEFSLNRIMMLNYGAQVPRFLVLYGTAAQSIYAPDDQGSFA